jgi:hypothetical protein
VVGGAAYAYGKHRQGQQQEQDYGGGYDEPPPPPPPAAAPAAAAPSAAIDYDQLAELGKLHTDGTLTDEEFAAAKAKILGA